MSFQVDYSTIDSLGIFLMIIGTYGMIVSSSVKGSIGGSIFLFVGYWMRYYTSKKVEKLFEKKIMEKRKDECKT